MKLEELLLNPDQRDKLSDQIMSLVHQRDKLTAMITMLSAVVLASDMAESGNPLIDVLRDYCEQRETLQ